MPRAEPHVLVTSTMLDLSTDAVVRELQTHGVKCTRLNTETYPFEASLTITLGDTASIALRRAHDAESIDLEPTSIWFRRVRSPSRPEEMAVGVYDFCLRESRSTLLGALGAWTGRIMSRPANVWRAEHKIVQLRTACECGLLVPETVVTNEPAAVEAAFRAFGGRMIAKAARSGFVDYGDEQYAVFTTRVLEEHLAQREAARWSPAIYQRLIDKKSDVRVTYVDGMIFAAEIDSQADPAASIDWRRTNDPALPHRPLKLPVNVENRVRDLMTRLGLVFGALDFARTMDDQFVFFEVNPNGQWLWLEDRLELPITSAIAGWLARVEDE